MSTELAEQTIAKPVILYAVTDQTIVAMKERFAKLQITGVEDRTGYELVHKARMECVKARSNVEKTRKELKAESLEFGRKVDSEAKRLIGAIEQIELPLSILQEGIDAERARIKREAEDKIFESRFNQLAAVDAAPNMLMRAYLLALTDEAFRIAVDNAREAKRQREEAKAKAEAERLERERIAREEAEAARLERERLAAERAKFEAEQKAKQEELNQQRKEQEAKEAALKAESDRLAKLERDRLEAERLEKVKAEAAEKARLDAERLAKLQAEAAEKARAETEARLKREAEDAERKRQEAEAEAKRAEELKPVKQKIFEFAVYVRDLELPDVGDTEKKLITNILDIAGRAIHDVGKGLK